MEPGLLFGLLIALAALDRGIAVKRGSLRNFAGTYRDAGNPLLLRNAPFALLPIALTAFEGVLAAMSVSLGVPRTVTAVLLGLFPLLFAGCVVVALRPPSALKPRWVLEEEALDGPPTKLHIADFVFGGGLIGVGLLGTALWVFIYLRT